MNPTWINWAKPILFNDEMVRSILKDEKTCTRRYADIHAQNVIKKGIGFFETMEDETGHTRLVRAVHPICEINDILYVRETWSELKKLNKDGILVSSRYVYRATDEYPFGEKYIAKFKWHPSIHMPKDAARIFLRVTDINIEHLQDISDEDIIREGAKDKEDFIRIWNSTIDKSQLSFKGWDANPWVIVYKFKRLD